MRKTALSLLALLILSLAACSGEEEQASQDNASHGQAVTEKNENPDVSPLTGLPAEGNTEQRAVGVMVNNHPKARPQTGLSKADIVFEMLAEGSITRFLAIYQSQQPDVVGPVRSAREYYFDLADGYDALYVYHGAANFVNDMIADEGIEHLDGALHDNDGNLFKRSSDRSAPHNSYLQFASVNDMAEQKGYNVTQSYQPLPFADEDEAAAASGDEAASVTIDYSGGMKNVVTYSYDEGNAVYNRYSNGNQSIEKDADEPVTADNLFIIETPHEIIDDAGRREIDITSGGDAYLVQKGHIRKVQWENRDGRIIPVKNGDPVPFVPGKTWINVVPADPGMAQSVTVSNE
ncbi:DUF3048 domain-containing protein [Barrientosiimonas marina]|uniref:DUF3048 domain-containing protein n=1 Tax=Lentibacillus kimchii TaxID=1542911 RepID=A0ABW2UTF1_9BACI